MALRGGLLGAAVPQVSEEDRAWFAALQRRMVEVHLGLNYAAAFLAPPATEEGAPPAANPLAAGGDPDSVALRSLAFADFLGAADQRRYAEARSASPPASAWESTCCMWGPRCCLMRGLQRTLLRRLRASGRRAGA